MYRTNYLSKFVIKQFDIKVFRRMIEVFLNLVDNFELLIDDEEFYLKLTPSYEIKGGSSLKLTNSKVESFIIKKYDSIDKKKELIVKYKVAFNSLNDLERKIFYSTFKEDKSTSDLCDELYLYPKKINAIRNSAVVKFCLKLGFDRFMDYFR